MVESFLHCAGLCVSGLWHAGNHAMHKLATGANEAGRYVIKVAEPSATPFAWMPLHKIDCCFSCPMVHGSLPMRFLVCALFPLIHFAALFLQCRLMCF